MTERIDLLEAAVRQLAECVIGLAGGPRAVLSQPAQEALDKLTSYRAPPPNPSGVLSEEDKSAMLDSLRALRVQVTDAIIYGESQAATMQAERDEARAQLADAEIEAENARGVILAQSTELDEVLARAAELAKVLAELELTRVREGAELAEARRLLSATNNLFEHCDNMPPCNDDDEPLKRGEWCPACDQSEKNNAFLASPPPAKGGGETITCPRCRNMRLYGKAHCVDCSGTGRVGAEVGNG
jgi:hypothetical protein